MTSKREKNRKLVEDFYRMAFQENRHEEAIRTYAGPKYVQHNPFVPDGAEGFVTFFAEWQENKSPHFRQDILRVVADEEYVAVHAHMQFGPDKPSTVLVDIFRIEDDRIVEHWDVYREVPDPATVPHSNGVL